MVIARKRGERPAGTRGVFVCLKRRPRNAIEASEMARAIHAFAEVGGQRRLEDGPYGGAPIRVGLEVVGEALDCPLVEGEQWPVAGIADLALAQTAYQLTTGRLWLPGQAPISAIDIPMTSLGQMGQMGFLHRDINGSGGRGSFDIRSPGSASSTYPTLWGHDAKRERAMMVHPDSEAVVRVGKEERAAEIWTARSRAHHNSDLRFNSQPLAVAYTEHPSLGGRSWPNVLFEATSHEMIYALWGNSSLGLLCYWWHATKEQSGRGVMPRTQARRLPTLDPRGLSKSQLSAAETVFDEMRKREMLPFNEAYRDAVRQELDERLLVEVLGLNIALLEPLSLLRRKLCAEPSVHGGKNSRPTV